MGTDSVRLLRQWGLPLILRYGPLWDKGCSVGLRLCGFRFRALQRRAGVLQALIWVLGLGVYPGFRVLGFRCLCFRVWEFCWAR